MREDTMADAKEVLEMMREVARSRIDMISNGITLYNDEKKAFYLDEYGKKLQDIERLIRKYSLRLVHTTAKDLPPHGNN